MSDDLFPFKFQREPGGLQVVEQRDQWTVTVNSSHHTLWYRHKVKAQGSAGLMRDVLDQFAPMTAARCSSDSPATAG